MMSHRRSDQCNATQDDGVDTVDFRGIPRPSASLSERTGFVNSDSQVWIFPWDLLKTIQEEVYSFTKLTGRLLLEVAVNKDHLPAQSHP